MARDLIIAPHMDDEVLGVGGTICKHIKLGDLVKVLFIANRVYNHTFDQQRLEVEEGHALQAKEVLGYQEVEFARLPDENLSAHFVEVLKVIERTAQEFGPEIVYLNYRNDPHQDHKVVFETGLICFRPIASLPRRVRRIACYEVPSATEQAGPFVEHAFIPTFYIDISGFVAAKQRAMACYETESKTFPHPRSKEGIQAVATARGIRAGLTAAEAFMVLYEEWA